MSGGCQVTIYIRRSLSFGSINVCINSNFQNIYSFSPFFPRYGMCRQFSRLKSAEKYDQLTGAWEPIASLNEARSGVGVVAIGKRMYAIGGYDGKNYLKFVILDSLSNLQLNLNKNVLHSRSKILCYRLTCFPISLDHLTYTASSVEEYDPKTDMWRRIAPMKHKRRAHGAVAINGCVSLVFRNIVLYCTMFILKVNRGYHYCADYMICCRYIYVYGGFDGVSFLKSVERYDPYLKLWETMNDMPLAKAYFGSTVL